MWLLRGTLRATIGVTLVAGLCAGVALAVAFFLTGSDPVRAVTIGLYIGDALAVAAALVPHSTLPTGAYGELVDTSAIRAGHAARATDMLLGVALVGLGVAVDALFS